MIRYIKQNNGNIDMKRIRMFSLVDFSYYIDNNVGKHYGISVGIGNKQLHLLFRQWNITQTLSQFYDA
jgi:hypothetical protein